MNDTACGHVTYTLCLTSLLCVKNTVPLLKSLLFINYGTFSRHDDVTGSDNAEWSKVADLISESSVACSPSQNEHHSACRGAAGGEIVNTPLTTQLLRSLESLVLPFIAAGDASKLRQSTAQANGATPPLRPLVDRKTPDELAKLVDLGFPNERLGKDRLVQHIQQVLKYSVNPWDQGFMDKLYSATNPVCLEIQG